MGYQSVFRIIRVRSPNVLLTLIYLDKPTMSNDTEVPAHQLMDITPEFTKYGTVKINLTH